MVGIRGGVCGRALAWVKHRVGQAWPDAGGGCAASHCGAAGSPLEAESGDVGGGAGVGEAQWGGGVPAVVAVGG